MKCGTFRDMLADLIGRELDAASEAAARRHMESCEACGNEARELMAAARLVETTCPPSTGHGGPDRHPEGVRRDSAPAPRYLLRAASIALAFSVGFLARDLTSTPRPEPIPSHASVEEAEPADFVRRVSSAAARGPDANPLSWSLISLAK